MPEDMLWLTRFRTALFLVLIHSFLPMLVLLTYISFQQRANIRQQVDNNLEFVLNLTNNSLEQQINQTKILLKTLANTTHVLGFQKIECSVDLVAVIEGDTAHTGIVVTNLNGDPVCSAFKDPANKTANIADRPYFQEVIKTKDFVVSSYAVGRFSGKPVILFAYPILNNSGDVSGVIVAAVDLDWMNQILAEASLPEGTSMMVLDHQDNIVARWPDPEKYIGQNMSDNEMVKTIHAMKLRRSETVGVGIDGMERLYKHTHIAAANDHLHLYFGLPTDFVDRAANEVLRRNIILAVIVSVGMILLVAIDWRIITNVRRLSTDK